VTHHIDTCFAALRARLLGAVGIVRARLAEQAAGEHEHIFLNTVRDHADCIVTMQPVVEVSLEILVC
jgi:hypothetical protein